MATTITGSRCKVVWFRDLRISLPSLRVRIRAAAALKLLASAAVVALVFTRFSDLDSRAVWDHLVGSGWGLAFILVPALCALAADTAGLAACVRAPFTARLLIRVLPARLACDSVCNALPGGVAMAEPVRSILLARALKMAVTEGVAAMLMAKVNMAASQALFLGSVGLCFFLGGRPRGIAEQFPIIEHAVIPAAILLGALSALVVVFYSGWHPPFLGRSAGAIEEVSTHIRSLSRGSIRKLAGSIGLFLGGWVFAGLEAYVILTILGADVSVVDGLLLEGIASLLRIAFFFLPSAVGAAEVGYGTLIAAFGVGDPVTVSAAFIMLKRSREILWIAVGLLVLLSLRWKSGYRLHVDRSS